MEPREQEHKEGRQTESYDYIDSDRDGSEEYLFDLSINRERN